MSETKTCWKILCWFIGIIIDPQSSSNWLSCRIVIAIEWQGKNYQCVQYNVDASVRETCPVVGCEDILRDFVVETWMTTFTCKLGSCSIITTKDWERFPALQHAWDMGKKSVSIESDSLTAVKILQQRVLANHSYFDLIRLGQSLVNRRWRMRITHIHR